MKSFAYLIGIILAFSSFYSSYAQKIVKGKNTPSDSREKVFQMSGLVLKRSTGEPIPFVKITTPTNKRYGISNEDGFYSIPVVERDTVLFECIGFRKTNLIVKDYLKSYKGDTGVPFLYSIEYMLEDTITLPTVTIYPYQTPEDIRQALLHVREPYQLSIDQAQMNVSPELMSYFMNNLPTDESERLKVAQQRYVELYQQQTMRPSFNLVDPVAIYRLIQHIKKKSKN